MPRQFAGTSAFCPAIPRWNSTPPACWPNAVAVAVAVAAPVGWEVVAAEVGAAAAWVAAAWVAAGPGVGAGVASGAAWGAAWGAVACPAGVVFLGVAWEEGPRGWGARPVAVCPVEVAFPAVARRAAESEGECPVAGSVLPDFPPPEAVPPVRHALRIPASVGELPEEFLVVAVLQWGVLPRLEVVPPLAPGLPAEA